jgi:hypothetical protein
LYFDFSNAFDILPHALLFHKLSNYGLSSGYLKLFLSYLVNRHSRVRYSGMLSTPFVELSGVPQGSVLGPLLFNIFINDLCDVMNHSNYLLFVDDLKVYRAISSPNDCLLLQSDIDRVYNWCLVNFVKPNFSKIRVISFTRETKDLNYQYRLGNSFILRTNCVKNLCVHIDCKLHFHHVGFFHVH